MVIAITVEVLTSSKGLGVIIWFAWQTMRIEELYSALIITALLGVVINTLLYRLSVALVPWAGHDPEDQL
jgi:ABC-type nitrate/sulfonate/bicarbonate transport system permease component